MVLWNFLLLFFFDTSSLGLALISMLFVLFSTIYLPQHHGLEHGLQVGQVAVPQLGHNAGVQQHQL